MKETSVILTGPKSHHELLEKVESFSRDEAANVLEQLRHNLKEAEKNPDKAPVAWTLLFMAMTLRGQRQYSAAFKLLDRALRLFELSRDPLGMGWVYQELSISNREFDRNALALDYGHKALQHFQEAGESSALAWVYDNLAIIHSNHYNRHEGLTFGKKARALFIDLPSKSGMAWNACNLGRIYVEIGSYPHAEESYLEAIKLFEQTDNRQGQAWALLGLAIVSRRQSKFEKAREYVSRAKSIFKELGLRDRIGWCMLNEAAIDRLTGKISDAIQINRDAIQLFSPLRNRDGVAWALFQLGQIYREQGQLIKAWQTFREAHNLHTDIANREGMGWSENDWGETYLQLNDLSHARESFIKAKVIAEQLDAVPLKVDVDENLSSLYLEEGFIQKASKTTDECEEGARKIDAKESLIKILMTKARQMVLLKEIAKARTCIEEARLVADMNELVWYRPHLMIYSAEILALEGKQAEAIQILKKVAEEATEFQQRRSRVDAFMGLIQLWRVQKAPLEQFQPLVTQMSKDMKVMGSRKLKAKYLALKALVEFSYRKKVEPKGLHECVRILESAGLVVVEYQLLKFFEDIFKKKNMARETEECQTKLKELLEKNPVDLYLVQPRFEDSPLPISLIS